MQAGAGEFEGDRVAEALRAACTASSPERTIRCGQRGMP